MRKLNTQDVFKLARLIKRADLRQDISNLFKKGNLFSDDDEGKKELGIEVTLIVVEKMADENVEREFYSLLSSIAEKNPEDIKNMSLESTTELMIQIGKENNITTFFKAAYQSAMK